MYMIVLMTVYKGDTCYHAQASKVLAALYTLPRYSSILRKSTFYLEVRF